MEKQVWRRGRKVREGTKGSSRGQQVSGGDLLADERGLGVGRGEPRSGRQPQSQGREAERGPLPSPLFPSPNPDVSEQEEIFKGKFQLQQTFSVPGSHTRSTLSSLRAGIHITKLTRPGLQMVGLLVGRMLKPGPLLGQALSLCLLGGGALRGPIGEDGWHRHARGSGWQLLIVRSFMSVSST